MRTPHWNSARRAGSLIAVQRGEFMRRFWIVVIALLGTGAGLRAHAEGEATNGFPNWSERVLLEWMNRARSDPATDLAGCPSGNCTENTGGCYTAQPPRTFTSAIAHSARFHSDEMVHDNFFDHWSECIVVGGIASTYLSVPQGCDGTKSCACTGGVRNLGSGNGTDPKGRMSLFGGDTSSWGEIIAENGGGPDATFYAWLYEPTTSSLCSFHTNGDNGHRFLILTSEFAPAAAGPGVSGDISTVDFDNEAGTGAKIPSGTHYPEQAATVDAWVNWNASAGPAVHQINVGGVCTNLTLTRGTQMNGAWHASVSGVGTGCHRYVFSFKDSGGNTVLYPTTGSLAIGNGSASCPDWSSATVTPCTDDIFKDGFE